MTLYSPVDYLPTIPDEFIPDIADIIRQENVCPTGNIKIDSDSIFKVFAAHTDLHTLLCSYFPHTVINVRWQLVTADLPIHYDWGTSVYKYIYLISKGGSGVKTQFWDAKENDPINGGSIACDDRSLILEVSEQERSWFKINVKSPHRVVGIEHPRLALIIRPAS
jgi:hypothetical protein